jgi:hypothetical protein
MKFISALSCIPLLVSACSGITVYDRAAKNLTASVWRASTGLVSEWQPLGISPPRKPTKEEEDKAATAIAKCIQTLGVVIKGRYSGPSPTEAMAAGQLIICMQDSGWQYFVGEIFVT